LKRRVEQKTAQFPDPATCIGAATVCILSIPAQVITVFSVTIAANILGLSFFFSFFCVFDTIIVAIDIWH
jgi:hypothetical protein